MTEIRTRDVRRRAERSPSSAGNFAPGGRRRPKRTTRSSTRAPPGCAASWRRGAAGARGSRSTTARIVGQVWLQTLYEDAESRSTSSSTTPTSRISTCSRPRAAASGTRLLEPRSTGPRSNRIDRVVLWPTARSVTLYLRHGFSHGGDVMELNVIVRIQLDDRALDLGVHRRLRGRILPRQLERVVAAARRRAASAAAASVAENRRELGRRAERVAAALHEQHRPRRSPAGACRGARSACPGGCSGYPSSTRPATGSAGSAAATCVAIRPPIDLPPMNRARAARWRRSARTASITAR